MARADFATVTQTAIWIAPMTTTGQSRPARTAATPQWERHRSDSTDEVAATSIASTKKFANVFTQTLHCPVANDLNDTSAGTIVKPFVYFRFSTV